MSTTPEKWLNSINEPVEPALDTEHDMVETAVDTAKDGVVGQMSAIFDGVVMDGPNEGSKDRDSMDHVATKEAA